MPLGWLYRMVGSCRRAWYRSSRQRVVCLPVPVIVVGNLTVGGTGKTPVVAWLAEQLQAAGWRPGIISRGYKGTASSWPQSVHRDSDPNWVGDEPVLLARRSGCPVAVGPDRVAAAGLIMDQCDVLIADDGLQHYRLGRDFEIVVIDGERGLGNELCLPAGPLREPTQRLSSVDAVLVNGGEFQPLGVRAMRGRLVGHFAVQLSSGAQRSLESFRSALIHAVAGIGNPPRFFKMLEQSGLKVTAHPLADHATIVARQLTFDNDAVVLMTEKDAVKASALTVVENWWYVPVDFVLAEADSKRLMYSIEAAIGQPTLRA